jgi:hypothetical protein
MSISPAELDPSVLQFAERHLGRAPTPGEIAVLLAYRAHGPLDDDAFATKVAQSDVPDNMLSLLTALRAAQGG